MQVTLCDPIDLVNQHQAITAVSALYVAPLPLRHWRLQLDDSARTEPMMPSRRAVKQSLEAIVAPLRSWFPAAQCCLQLLCSCNCLQREFMQLDNYPCVQLQSGRHLSVT